MPKVLPMYGKSFESMFEGSMVGAGINVFAVWTYIITKARRGVIEINPKLLAFTLGGSESEVEAALEFLQQPDPDSRSKEEDGRRLVKEGQFQYRVVNYLKYQELRTEVDRREYNRVKQQEYRERKKLEAPEKPKPDPNYTPESRVALHYLNEKSGKRFRETESNLGFIQARLNEPEVDIAGIRQMIDRQCRLWLGTDMADYLRPETLFNKTKFDSYYAARLVAESSTPHTKNNQATHNDPEPPRGTEAYKAWERRQVHG